MPATDSFTSTASAVSSATATLTSPIKSEVFTRTGFFHIYLGGGGINITKAPTFGGSQAALSFPLTLDDARDLANELIKMVT